MDSWPGRGQLYSFVLFHDAVSIAKITHQRHSQVNEGLELWQNDNDRVKQKYRERKVSQGHYVRQKSHMDEHGTEAGPTRIGRRITAWDMTWRKATGSYN
jgi:hypothetical protein